MDKVAEKVALWVMLKAKRGKENDLAEFLKSAVPLVDAEPDTISWFALQIDSSTFGVFDTFAADTGRQAHLSGKVATALMAKAPELLSAPPSIEKIDLLAVTARK